MSHPQTTWSSCLDIKSMETGRQGGPWGWHPSKVLAGEMIPSIWPEGQAGGHGH